MWVCCRTLSRGLSLKEFVTAVYASHIPPANSYKRRSMIPLQSNTTQTKQPGIGFAFKTGLAFRPFFWLGAVFLLISFALWAAFLQCNLLVSPHGGLIWLPFPEMLYVIFGALIQ